MVIDCFTYNGERDILDIHLNSLTQYVDKFIVVEARTTFSGHKKPLYFSLNEKHFEKFWPKIEYYVIDENYSSDEIVLAETSPNTKGAKHWKREFLQKESIKKALIKYKVKDDDMCYIGDVDEIWEPYYGSLAKLKLVVYAYYLDNRSSEQFWGPIVGAYKEIKDECLNHLRVKAPKTEETYGVHFTSMGGLKEVRRKLNDSYTTESYNTYEVQSKLPERLRKGEDYLGRNFSFTKDTTDWPHYLSLHKNSYTHLCLPENK